MKNYAERCWLCGTKLFCSGNFMISDWEGIEMIEDDVAMITDYVCPNCGTEYSVTEPSEALKEHYNYWKKNIE